MATIIRINGKWGQLATLLVASAIFTPLSYGGVEAEIHVTTGPDGIEIFSNLPRYPIAETGRTIVAVISSAPLAEASSEQGSDTEAPGKAFLQDD